MDTGVNRAMALGVEGLKDWAETRASMRIFLVDEDVVAVDEVVACICPRDGCGGSVGGRVRAKVEG